MLVLKNRHAPKLSEAKKEYATGLLTYNVFGRPFVKRFALCYRTVVMVALCNRETIYIFMLWFVLPSSSSSFFSSPNLSGRRLDVYHTLAHGVALVRI